MYQRQMSIRDFLKETIISPDHLNYAFIITAATCEIFACQRTSEFYLFILFALLFSDTLNGNDSTSKYCSYRLSMTHKNRVMKLELLVCRLSVFPEKLCHSYPKDNHTIFWCLPCLWWFCWKLHQWCELWSVKWINSSTAWSKCPVSAVNGCT